MSDAEQFAGLEAFLDDRGTALLRTAVPLAGSREAGEDLLQLALELMLRRWQRVNGDPEPYLRRTLYHLAVDRWRWRTRHPEVDLTADLAYVERDPAAEADLRDALVQALASLPARQRAVLVLRYFEQLTEAAAPAGKRAAAGARAARRRLSPPRHLDKRRDLPAGQLGNRPRPVHAANALRVPLAAGHAAEPGGLRTGDSPGVPARAPRYPHTATAVANKTSDREALVGSTPASA